MALLSGEVETSQAGGFHSPDDGFRMALLSGEVETSALLQDPPGQVRGSGWLCYPGKLKLRCGVAHNPNTPPEFRMVWLSGEVETGLAVHRRLL